MAYFPKWCVVDTNVPKSANLALEIEKYHEEDIFSCIEQCIKSVNHVIQKGKLVLDEDGEIFQEYKNQLSLKGQPGMGDAFIKWVHDNQWKANKVNRVKITKTRDSFVEFPSNTELSNFDKSDRKFIAVANAHPKNPTVLQAVDSKWWGYREVFRSEGIKVMFLCPELIEKLFNRKSKPKIYMPIKIKRRNK